MNMRLMGWDGVTPETSAYMARQAARAPRLFDWPEARPSVAATPVDGAPLEG